MGPDDSGLLLRAGADLFEGRRVEVVALAIFQKVVGNQLIVGFDREAADGDNEMFLVPIGGVRRAKATHPTGSASEDRERSG